MRVNGQSKGIGVDCFRANIIPLACRLAFTIDELQWDARLDPFNHHPLFPTIITGIADTFPIRVSCPLSSRVHYLLSGENYQACVVKVQMVCNFLRDIIFLSGPHLGCENDGTLGVNHIDVLPCKRNEMWLTDGIYFVCCRLLIPHRTPRNGSLTRRQIIENDLFGTARSPIEHENVMVVRHGMFEGRNTGAIWNFWAHFSKSPYMWLGSTSGWGKDVFLELHHGAMIWIDSDWVAVEVHSNKMHLGGCMVLW